ncbi:hypothetical protein SDC9_189674 [bioreactor metagenome]|uniref:Uncharacterized protein n=1 Tax=bioreactor metagenome TaxID=1076179 RepID=A0A645HSU2_9ZZZZ|nr:MAG: hypothetical protein BGO33_05700 [Bacteroidia bacterium 43-41]
MNIDFPPPSNGVYNNAGSCRQLMAYLEHEDLQRMEQGIYTEGFFNLTDGNIYKSQVIKELPFVKRRNSHNREIRDFLERIEPKLTSPNDRHADLTQLLKT